MDHTYSKSNMVKRLECYDLQLGHAVKYTDICGSTKARILIQDAVQHVLPFVTLLYTWHYCYYCFGTYSDSVGS